MKCRDCHFYHSGYLWNRCDLTESEYYHECISSDCDIIDDNYIFIEDCEPMGFVKGKSALEYMNGGDTNV